MILTTFKGVFGGFLKGNSCFISFLIIKWLLQSNMRRLLLPSWVGSSSTVDEHCSSTASCNCGLVQDTKHWILRESCAAIVVDCYRSSQNNHNRKIMEEIQLGNTTIELPLIQLERMRD